MQTSSQTRTYNRSDCITFRKTKEAFGGLSNMAGGYPLTINGIHILTSEALYQACRFPHLPDVQKLIISQKSPMTAKMKSKPYRDQSRSDWDQIRVKIMRWCLRVKLIQNWDKFGQLLLETGDKPIVEDSRKDNFWGAIPVDNEQLVGINVLGRLLMELREKLKTEPQSLIHLEPLNITDFLFLDQPIQSLKLNNSNLILIENYYSENEITQKTQDNESQLIIETPQEHITNNQEVIKINQEATLADLPKESNIFDDWVLPKLEQILQTTQSLDQILQKFKTVNKKQMQDWLKLAIDLGKVNKLDRPVRYIWYSATEAKYYSPKSNKLKTTKTRVSQSVRTRKNNSSSKSKQLSLI